MSSEDEPEVGSIQSLDSTDAPVKIEGVPVKKRIVKTEDDSVPLPDPFPLPKHYGQDIEVALERKTMSSKEKRRFISEVASAMLRFKRYPTHDDYLCVARSVVKKYPFLKSSDAKPCVSCMESTCLYLPFSLTI